MRLRLVDARTTRFADPKRLYEEEEQLRKQNKEIQYGILSHRWLANEDKVKLQHMHMQADAIARKLPLGYKKITECCRLAQEDRSNHVWLDTCCIDKSNSAELQESINSMFRWYQEAAGCYAYLKDTASVEAMPPTPLKFYNKECCYTGDKNGLKDNIRQAMGISVDLLDARIRLEEFSIAERMSRAARRTTAVTEARAHSLFDIFDVNMPMLCGEGGKAFARQQEEIIKKSDDHSIFAWAGVTDTQSDVGPRTWRLQGLRVGKE
ncbi:heterokaryon incompatibility protein-domain-containing protein [Xylariales sp. AK1849]|nr:heterokaryon incompatibility protein-domain-containing protein [Xylariales sp. AK1849]